VAIGSVTDQFRDHCINSAASIMVD